MKILKATRGKAHITYRGIFTEIITDFTPETMEALSGTALLKCCKKRSQHRILYSAKNTLHK